MSIGLQLVYAEYESGAPPFVWLNGQRLSDAEKQRAHQLISQFREGDEVRDGAGVAVRRKHSSGMDLLIQTTAGFQHRNGDPQRVVVVLSGLEAGSPGWEGSMAAEMARILEGADIYTNQAQFREVIAWATKELNARNRRNRLVAGAVAGAASGVATQVAVREGDAGGFVAWAAIGAAAVTVTVTVAGGVARAWNSAKPLANQLRQQAKTMHVRSARPGDSESNPRKRGRQQW